MDLGESSSMASPHVDSPTEQHSSSTPTSGLNPRSCVICRRRKVRCNKTYPCSNCAKAKVQCIFPAPERAKRRPRKPPDGELMNRLRRLEGVIQGMGMSVEEELAASAGNGPKTQEQIPLPQGQGSGPVKADLNKQVPPSPTTRLGSDFGRLVVNEGKSRYVNNRFWATLTNEVEDLKGILDDTSDEEADFPSPSTDPASPPPDAAFFFNYSSLAYDLHSFHPTPEQIWEYWCIYKEYNDPVIKMVHIPTMEKQIQAAMHQPGKSHKPLEAFLFAVYFAAVTAMTPDAVLMRFGETRDALVRRYKFGVEQALARANFLISEEMLVLQAYITYLVCLRCHEDGRVLWSLNGVAVRIAISMGLQRDGTNFNIPPFESEMRRRVWWQLVALEWRGSQDSGIEPIILTQPGCDTQIPLNINDEDISPGMKQLPPARKGLSDMTFCILRYDLQRGLHKLFAPNATLNEKERLITETHQHLENDYFKYCDMSRPLDWTICTVAKLIMARQFLILYHPHIKTLPQVTIDRLFVTALDTIEFALRLETERKMVKWGWLFKTYNQWHALAFLLSELTRRTKGPLVQRAWRAVNSTLAEFRTQYHDSKRGQLWRPVIKLLQTARQARERELVLEAQSMQSCPMEPIQGMESSMNGIDMTPIKPIPADETDVYAPGANYLDMKVATENDSYAMPNEMMMPTLEPTKSTQSNSIDDQYLFDNTSNNMPITSQFFANTPGTWQNPGQVGMAEQGLSSDWFGSWATENNVNVSTMPELDPSMLNSMAMNQQAWQDPMVGGGDTPGTGSQYTDWDEVMREFAMEGQNGQNSMGVQWTNNKPPNALLAETWL